jgi:plastocyanin
MRFRVCALLALALATSASASAKEVFLSIAGSVGNFRTDTHIFNPSATKDIVLQATFLRAGGDASHPDNSAAQAKTITIPRRSTAVYDDVVSSLFQTTGLGGIRLQSDDDFLATQRIYADEVAGTLGQFIVGPSRDEALTKGVVMQLRSNGTGGKGSFRTNLGMLNPNGSAADVTLRLYDARNLVVATKTVHLLPLGVVQPLNVNGLFTAPGADLSNFFVTFEATLPIFAYGSFLDNGSVDPAYVAAQPDSGTDLPQQETYDVTLRSFEIEITPTPNIAPGDEVVFRIRAEGDTHGFELADPSGHPVIPSGTYSPGDAPISYTFTASTPGTYGYYCTVSFCGGFYLGHFQMNGSFDVGHATARRSPPPHAHHHP